MDILGRARLSLTQRQHPLPASFVPVPGLDSPEGLRPVALNPQRRRHLDPPPLARLFRSFPEVGPLKGAEARTEGGIYTERPPMKMRGGSFPSPTSARALPIEAGSWQESRKRSNCVQSRRCRAGARVRVSCSGEHLVRRLCAVKRSGHNRGALSHCARACVLSWSWERNLRWLGHLIFSAFPAFPNVSPGRPPPSSCRPSRLPTSLSKGPPLFTPGGTEGGIWRGKSTVAFTESACTPCTFHLLSY